MTGTLILLALLWTDPGDIGKVNAAKADAKKAYLAGDYKGAAEKYRYLIDSAGVAEEEVYMNLANSYFNLNDTAQAIGSYQRLTQSDNNKVRSRANLQLGVLNNREGKFEEALQFLKQSLKADPANNDARYNYEMIKKKLEEEKKKQQQQQDQNKDQNEEQKDEQNKDSKEEQNKDKKDQQNTDEKKEQEKKDQEQKEKDEKSKEQRDKEQQDKEQQEKDAKELPPSVKDKLKEMNMSEEKARMILEAMKAQEIQYLQQNKRKGTKPKDKNKPDW